MAGWACRCAPPPTPSSPQGCTTGWRMRWWSTASGSWAAAAYRPSGSGAGQATRAAGGHGVWQVAARRNLAFQACQWRAAWHLRPGPRLLVALCSTHHAWCPPLCSYYVHGHRQGLHSDAPHGGAVGRRQGALLAAVLPSHLAGSVDWLWLSFAGHQPHQLLGVPAALGAGWVQSVYVATHRCTSHANHAHVSVPTSAGPFAFVLSLTRWEERRFSGGETVLLQPWVLDYWRHFDPAQGTETPQLVRPDFDPDVAVCLGRSHRQWLHVSAPTQPLLVRAVCSCPEAPRASCVPHPWPLPQMTLVPPRFNQLTVFDGRIPHAVQQVGKPARLLPGAQAGGQPGMPCQQRLPA